MRLGKNSPPAPHGESVLARRAHLELAGFRRALGVAGHAQVVEEQAGVARQALDSRGDRILGAGLEDADGEAAQRGDVLGAVAGADGAAILIPVPVEHVVAAVLNAPVGAIEGEHGGRRGAGGAVAGDAADRLGGGLGGLLHGDLTFDEEDLGEAGEVEIVVEAGGGPDCARLDASMGEVGRFLEVGHPARGEQQPDRVSEPGLIVFDGEDVVGVVLAQIGGQLALGQQGVGGDGLAGELEGFEERDDHPDLVGLFGLVPVADGQGTDFFWV